ncbi:MAG: LPS assembly lipoprotein LptE [Hylemonella sp.]
MRLTRPAPDPKRRTALRLAGALPASLLLAACGFRLRQAPEFAFKSIYAGLTPGSLIGIELKRYLRALGGVELITDAERQKEAQVLLVVLQEQREKVIVGGGAVGQVRELQLRLRFRFRVVNPQGRELIAETELLQVRDQSYNEAFANAKASEEIQLYNNMQSDIVQQVLRRLAAIREI